MKNSAPMKLMVQYPKTEEGKRALAKCVAGVHADFIISTLHKLNCPTKQKLELLQAVIDTMKGTYQSKKQGSSEEVEK